MRRRARFGGGGLVCTGEASSVDAETLVGGSSRFLGERFVFEMSAALGGVGGFLLLVKKSVMERCCDICVIASESVSAKGRFTRSSESPRQLDSPVNAHATAMRVIGAAWAARGAKVQPWPKEAQTQSVRSRFSRGKLLAASNRLGSTLQRRRPATGRPPARSNSNAHASSAAPPVRTSRDTPIRCF